MDSTVMAGWIGGLSGLGGAAVGAAGAVWGAWRQQKHERDQARADREHAQHDSAYEGAVQALFSVKALFRRQWRRDVDKDWEPQLLSELDRLRLAALSFTSTDLRTRLEEGVEILTYWKKTTHTEIDHGNRPRLVIKVIEHLVSVLGEYRRGTEISEPPVDYRSAKEGVFLYIEEMEAEVERDRESNA
ncbi:hypothetical protein [Streptomyces massasporeus]|uniref:hypothetical protein n=1 Tax=Streptomyces massasporeus TaxID=67324 RepID=UPI003701976D